MCEFVIVHAHMFRCPERPEENTELPGVEVVSWNIDSYELETKVNSFAKAASTIKC